MISHRISQKHGEEWCYFEVPRRQRLLSASGSNFTRHTTAKHIQQVTKHISEKLYGMRNQSFGSSAQSMDVHCLCAKPTSAWEAITWQRQRKNTNSEETMPLNGRSMFIKSMKGRTHVRSFMHIWSLMNKPTMVLTDSLTPSSTLRLHSHFLRQHHPPPISCPVGYEFLSFLMHRLGF